MRRDPFFKPDWSPETFMSYMYTCHISVYRRTLLEELSGLRPGFEGSQDYDLVLRVMEKTTRIGHVPKILYHWRMRKEPLRPRKKRYSAGGRLGSLPCCRISHSTVSLISPRETPLFPLLSLRKTTQTYCGYALPVLQSIQTTGTMKWLL